MPTTTGGYEIHSEPHGPHWVAWVTRGGAAAPDRSIVVIAASKDEAESRARLFAEQSSY